jgi:Plant transposon protein
VVVVSLENTSSRRDATGKAGASNLQKVVSALRQHCYAISMDDVEEYTGLGESSSRGELSEFCYSVVRNLSEKYLRKPTKSDLTRLEAVYRLKGFPGCIGCLDCTGWSWDISPVAHQGIKRGKSKYSELRMEVIFDESLWIWHVSLDVQVRLMMGIFLFFPLFSPQYSPESFLPPRLR